MSRFCQHAKLHTTCPECRPDPFRDFVRSYGATRPHVLTQYVLAGAIGPHQLPHVDRLGEGKVRRVLEGIAQDAYWREHRRLYPGGSGSSKEWAWVREQILARDGHACQVCGRTESLQVDHILPLSQGGTNSPANLWSLCTPCHSIKTGRSTDPEARRRTPEQRAVAEALRGRDFVERA